jgi:uracil-DNA glycosylase
MNSRLRGDFVGSALADGIVGGRTARISQHPEGENSMSTPEKQQRYLSLVQLRKSCRRCSPELTNPAVCDGGRFDSAEIGPWSRWQGNLDAAVLIVGQDWGDDRSFIKDAGKDQSNNPTNLALTQLVTSLGISLAAVGVGSTARGTIFLTNAILCLKAGGLQAGVLPIWFDNCGRHFLKPTIDLVGPKVVITLGEAAFRALEKVYGFPKRTFRDTVCDPNGIPLGDGALLFPMYHCGRRIQNTHRSMPQQMQDWKRVLPALANERKYSG